MGRAHSGEIFSRGKVNIWTICVCVLTFTYFGLITSLTEDTGLSFDKSPYSDSICNFWFKFRFYTKCSSLHLRSTPFGHSLIVIKFFEILFWQVVQLVRRGYKVSGLYFHGPTQRKEIFRKVIKCLSRSIHDKIQNKLSLMIFSILQR
jgi:hypothetical protein